MHTLQEQLRSVGMKERPIELQAVVSVDARKAPAQQWLEAVKDVKPLKVRK